MRKSIFGLSLLALALIAAACGGGSLEGEEVLVFGAAATDGPDGQAIQMVFHDLPIDRMLQFRHQFEALHLPSSQLQANL